MIFAEGHPIFHKDKLRRAHHDHDHDHDHNHHHNINNNKDGKGPKVPSSVEYFRKKIDQLKPPKGLSKDKIVKSLELSPALKNILDNKNGNSFDANEKVKDAAKRAIHRMKDGLHMKKAMGHKDHNGPFAVTAFEYSDRDCKNTAITYIKYTSCVMGADFGTWENIRFSGPNNENATVYSYNHPGCPPNSGRPYKTYSNGVCQVNPRTGKSTMWKW